MTRFIAPAIFVAAFLVAIAAVVFILRDSADDAGSQTTIPVHTVNLTVGQYHESVHLGYPATHARCKSGSVPSFRGVHYIAQYASWSRAYKTLPLGYNIRNHPRVYEREHQVEPYNGLYLINDDGNFVLRGTPVYAETVDSAQVSAWCRNDEGNWHNPPGTLRRAPRHRGRAAGAHDHRGHPPATLARLPDAHPRHADAAGPERLRAHHAHASRPPRASRRSRTPTPTRRRDTRTPTPPPRTRTAGRTAMCRARTSTACSANS